MKVISAMHLGQMKHSNSNVLWAVFGIGLVIAWLLLWEWSVRFGLSRQFFVPPSRTHSVAVSVAVRLGRAKGPYLGHSHAVRWWICDRSYGWDLLWVVISGRPFVMVQFSRC
jgi:hypothetical protein